MHKPVLSAVLSGALLASILVTPAGAQESGLLCNGLEATIVGTEGNDVLQGTFRDDVIVALGGDDQIRGASGADVICGGSGDDVIYGDSQNDVIFGGDGDDIIHGGSDEDEIHGGDGDDEIFGNSQRDALFGDAGDDNINGGADEDSLDGGTGHDVLNGLWQNDTCVNGEVTQSCENVLPGTPDAPVGPVLLTETEVAWLQGSSEWVNLLWTTDSDLANVEVRLTTDSSELEVEYPSDSDRSRLSVDTGLSVSEIDYTAVRLTTGVGVGLDATIEISWDDADGQRQTNEFALTLTNRQYEGEDFAILTDVVTAGTDVENPAANWVDFQYRGIAPTNNSIELTVTSDLPVHYPQDTFTSLYHDEVLHSGEADVASIWFDPELVAPGTYTVVVNIDYVNTNGVDSSTSHEVELIIE